jgi:hypothetical protein
MTKNHWEKQAEIEEFNKRWEEGVAVHLEGDKYCQELTERNREYFSEAGSDPSWLAARGANGEFVGIFSPRNLSCYPENDPFSSTTPEPALIDPKKPFITDDDIMRQMGLGVEDKKELVEFMRMHKRMERFGALLRSQTAEYMQKSYHICEYRGEFGGI